MNPMPILFVIVALQLCVAVAQLVIVVRGERADRHRQEWIRSVFGEFDS